MLKIVLIGAGNLATHLAKQLLLSVNHITQIYSRTEVSAQILAHKVEAPYVTEFSKIINDADFYFVCLKDSALTEHIAEITAGKGNAMIVHTAGSIPMDIFKNYATHYGVLYPMQTFSKNKEVDFHKIPCFIEASSTQDLKKLHTLASSLSDNVRVCSSEQRKYLHLAAVFTCNFTNHLYDIAYRFMQQHKLPFESLLPLIDETTAKIHTMEPSKAQTGPAIRYDKNVIDRQAKLLENDPDIQHIYQILSNNIHKFSK
jgi:predicted short-subunit dehydrogenase-like oxidoreductase (DUF2520 family)